MPVTEGTVNCMQIADGFGFVAIRTDPNTLEAFVLYFGDVRSPGPLALWIPELSIALARGLRVSITHGTDSAYIDTVQINSP